jgi:hypothetical protein
MADIGTTPQLEAPTLADLTRQIDARPLWQVRNPLQVDADTFDRALIEMRDVQERQGRTVAKATDIEQDNFLLRGIAVVKSE